MLMALAAITLPAQSGRQQQSERAKMIRRLRNLNTHCPRILSIFCGSRSASFRRRCGPYQLKPCGCAASVFDTQGRAITDLNLSDFQLLVDGTTQTS